ncbi:MAG: protein phosphatase 2C domain-containing protein [Pseudomonadota bacterium]
MHQLDVAVAQIVGAREYQEDAAAHMTPDGGTIVRTFAGVQPDAALASGRLMPADAMLCVIADGMGGHAAGDVASQLICDAFLDKMIAIYRDANGRADPAAGRLRAALNASNLAVAYAIEEDDALTGMGATLIGLEFRGAASDEPTTQPLDAERAIAQTDRSETAGTVGGVTVNWVSVGDSPLYLVRDRDIVQLNEDHSLAPALDKLVAEGRMTPEAARQDSRRHMLRSAITGETIELIDVSRKALELEEGDVVIAATDGVETLEPGEIARIATGYASDGAHAMTAALLRAVSEAREAHQDNATVLAVRVV